MHCDITIEYNDVSFKRITIEYNDVSCDITIEYNDVSFKRIVTSPLNTMMSVLSTL